MIAANMQGKQLSGSLVSAITERITEPTFDTTNSNTMRNNLERSRFTRVGSEWHGGKGILSLWTMHPDWLCHQKIVKIPRLPKAVLCQSP